MSRRYELLVADPAFGGTIATLVCPGSVPRTMLDLSRAPRVVADWLLTELNALLDRAEKAEAALDEAIARADKASNALIRTTAALRETIIRAEKAEARVAELEAQVAAWSPARCYGEEDDSKPEPSVAELEQRIATAKVGYYAPCAWCWSTVFAPNGEVVTCHKCGRKTPVPAPEPTETVQKAPPPSPVGAPRSDQAPNSAGQAGNPGPVLGHPRGSESSILDTLTFGKSVPVSSARPCEGCKGVTDSPANALCPVCRLRWQGYADDAPVTMRSARALTPEEADAYKGLLGDELADAPKRPRPPRIAPREPDVSAEVGLMGALQDRIHKEAGPYRAAKVTRVEEPKLVVSCFDPRCQCYQCVKDRADEEEDFKDLAKEQAKQAVVRQVQDAAYRAVTDILTRVEASPAAAAEVEARTNAVVSMSRDRTVEQRYADDALRATVTWGQASPENMLTVTFPDAWIVTPPRAGLPSRDEVAAFLERRWPKESAADAWVREVKRRIAEAEAAVAKDKG